MRGEKVAPDCADATDYKMTKDQRPVSQGATLTDFCDETSAERDQVSTVVLPADSLPISRSIKLLNEKSWIIRDSILITHHDKKPETNLPSWSDGRSGYFLLSKVACLNLSIEELARLKFLPEASKFPVEFHQCTAERNGIWSFGDAFCKIVLVEYPESTRESTTLNWLQEQKADLSFEVPSVLYHLDLDNISITLMTRVQGRTLLSLWLDLTIEERRYYVDLVAKAIAQLATWTGHAIAGVDGGHLQDTQLAGFSTPGIWIDDIRPQTLAQRAKSRGMDCSTFVFTHCDLAVSNIMVDRSRRTIGLVDWEVAGFVPKEWIVTKLDASGVICVPPDDSNDEYWYQQRLVDQLLQQGFGHVIEVHRKLCQSELENYMKQLKKYHASDVSRRWA